MTEKLRSKKGFTLVELSIVIAIMGVVVVMVVGFIAQYNKDTYALLRNRNAMKDINMIRSVTNEWLMYYDNGKYTIAPSDVTNGSTVLQAKNTSTGKVDSLEIKNGEIVWKKNNSQYKSFVFESVTNATFSFSKANQNGTTPIIACRVRFNLGQNWQDLLFSVMTQTPRTRYSPAED